jgi:hypothetical protein
MSSRNDDIEFNSFSSHNSTLINNFKEETKPKEITIAYVIQKVSLWRKFYNGNFD